MSRIPGTSLPLRQMRSQGEGSTAGNTRYSVPYLREEVAFVMRDRMATVAARKRVALLHPDKFSCCLTGNPCADAVRLRGGAFSGKLALEKAALLNTRGEDVQFSPDLAARREFETSVSAEKDAVPPPRKDLCISGWRAHVPEGGVPPFADVPFLKTRPSSPCR